MGSSSKTSTENNPPKWAKPLFEQSASEAQNFYNQGAGANTFLGSTVSPLSDLSMHGIGNLAQAGQNWDTSGTRPLFQGIGAASVGPSSADQHLAGYASGEYLQGEGNPFYRERLEREIADANSILRSQMSGAGRYGSDVSNRLIGEQTQNMLFRGLEEDFNRQTQNQFNAVGMMDQQRNLGLDRAMGATGAMAGLDQQNFENRLTGAGAQLQAGGMLDEQSQKLLNDEIAKFYALDNEDWTRLGLLQSAAAGAAGPYGTQLQHTRTSNPMAALGAIAPMFGGK